LSFVYVPELLLYGSGREIAFAAGCYFVGYVTLAMAIQGTDFATGQINWLSRTMFFGSAACFLMPMIIWLKIVGLALLVVAWGPLILRRNSSNPRTS